VSESTRLEGTVLDGTGGAWHVRTADGITLTAALRGRVKNESPLKLAVGDRVMLEQGTDGGSWAIGEILPRRSQLARREPGARFGERVLAANIDQVVVVLAAAQPEPNLRMLDRFLVIGEANELQTRIVINKLDLAEPLSVAERFRHYQNAGYFIHLTSVKRGRGIEELREAMSGLATVVTGPSGVGKSTLLNTMYEGLDLRVGEVSEAAQKGRHTTVGASLHPLPGPSGGFVVDTPGLREVGVWNMPPTDLPRYFPEFRELLDGCRFADCTHMIEPECAVRAAVHDGRVSAARYESYLRLRAEAAEAEHVLAPYGRRATREH
jgi:ribosome biogenesis GTPase / thiamine phosphate phosphatase